ncbi:MAG: aminopeptidase [Chloroflexi bacterium]|nr:aminopeptidase [Chloroflexota bacterium]
MLDPRADKVAQVMVQYSVNVQAGDLVVIKVGDNEAAPMALAVYRYVLEAGGHAVFRMFPRGWDEVFYETASEAQLDIPDTFDMWMNGQADVTINVGGEVNPQRLSHIEPARLARGRSAAGQVWGLWMERQAAGHLRWTGTKYPTLSAAQNAGMGLRAYEDFVYRTCMAHLDDPVAAWREFEERQQKLVDWLAGKKQMVVKGENIDLTLGIDGRKFMNSCGKHNMPDGEIFTGPVEDSVNGWVRFTYPAIYGGKEVSGAELWFENGRVVKSDAQQGADHLLSVLDTDEGARTLGEFAIGTNHEVDRFTRDILFDEKIGGTVHMAVGLSYPQTGGLNKSAVHWDMICDMRSGGEITVDGELFYQDGEFLV